MSLTPKQEKFAQEVASGKSQADAYRAAYNCAKSKPESIVQNASRLMADANVSSRVAELKAQLSEKALWSREDSVNALLSVIQNPDKQRDVVAAVKELNLMHGYEAPKEIKHSGGVTILAAPMDEDI